MILKIDDLHECGLTIKEQNSLSIKNKIATKT
jgi:hypothetical protein